MTLLALVVLLVCFAAYWNGLNGEFFFDDGSNILVVEGLQLKELSYSQLVEAWRSGGAGLGGRPLAQLSFALNYYFSGGFDPFAFKATNLIIHLIVGALVYFVAERLLGAPIYAFVAAMLWLLHPMQVTSVLYVVQRMTSLSALFVLIGFFLHATGRERAGRLGIFYQLIAWLFFWPLAFLSKETALLFPLFVLVWELIIRRHAKGYLDRFARILTAIIVFGCIASLAYLILPAGKWILAGYQMRSFTLVERLLTEGRVLWFYIGLLIFQSLEDFGLYHDDIQISTGLLTPWTTLLSIFGIIVILWVAWRSRDRIPLVSFGIIWFFVGHLLESTILPLEIAHEHRNYLPSFGLILISAWALERAVVRGGWQKTLGLALTVGCLGYSILITGLRAHEYGDEIRRTQIESQHHRASARTHYEAGLALAAFGDIKAGSPQYFFARSHYEQAGELAPDFKSSWLGLIQLNCLVGEMPESSWIVELSRRLRTTPFGPGDRNVLFSIKEMAIAGRLCLQRSDVEALFGSALKNSSVAPNVRAILHSWLADYFTLAVHDLPAGQLELDRSLEIAPQNPSNRLKWAQLAFLRGRGKDARAALDGLKDAPLVYSERETFGLLNSCLGPDGEMVCNLEKKRDEQQ